MVGKAGIMAKELFPSGVVVYVDGISSNQDNCLAVTTDQAFWEKTVPIPLLDEFKFIEREFPETLFQLFRILGTKVMPDKSYVKSDVELSDYQVVKYSFRQIGYIQPVIVLPQTINNLESFYKTFVQIKRMAEGSQYLNSVEIDLQTLISYLKGDYILDFHHLGPYRFKLLKIFEQGIPDKNKCFAI